MRTVGCSMRLQALKKVTSESVRNESVDDERKGKKRRKEMHNLSTATQKRSYTLVKCRCVISVFRNQPRDYEIERTKVG